jgi:hypothetical protein
MLGRRNRQADFDPRSQIAPEWHIGARNHLFTFGLKRFRKI